MVLEKREGEINLLNRDFEHEVQQFTFGSPLELVITFETIIMKIYTVNILGLSKLIKTLKSQCPRKSKSGKLQKIDLLLTK